MLLYVIQLIHGLFVAFIAYAPFSQNLILLQYHVVVVPFLVLHWVMNSNVCALTLIEAWISGKSTHETFLGRIVNPIYEVNINLWGRVILFILYSITLYNVYIRRDDYYKRYSTLKQYIFR